jgi:outer membrane receptor protein involved in Fe transport
MLPFTSARMRSFFLIFCFCLCPVLTFAQSATGSLQGRILDANGTEALVGASILVKNTTLGTATDLEGNFLIPRIPEGTYTLVITLIGYQRKEIPEVWLVAGKSTLVYTSLFEEPAQLSEVEVSVRRETGTDVSLLAELRTSQTVAVGVSAEQIARTQDSDGAQVLRRLPGISIFDDRFVMVRGLNERYNSVLLNGALAPSSEVDNKAFSFDVLPASVIDRMLVVKSGSYDLPGEFAGGIIRIFTKNTPEENFTHLSLSSGFRTQTLGRTMSRYAGGSTDWLGFDDGTRRLPAAFPGTGEMKGDNTPANLNTRVEAARLLSSTWLPQTYTALPDYKLSLGLGRRWRIGKLTLGNLTSVSYSNSRQLIDNLERDRYQQFNPARGRSGSIYDYNDNFSSQQVRTGVLHNWSLRFNRRHRLEFRNLFNLLGVSQTTVRNGTTLEQSTLGIRNYSLYYESRRIYSGQLAGFHRSGNERFTADWLTGYNRTSREEPDFRRYRTSYSADDNRFFLTDPSGDLTLDQNARFFSNLNESSYTAAGNLEWRLDKGDPRTPGGIRLKAGFYSERKNRDFAARVFVFRPSPLINRTENPWLKSPSPEVLFTPASIGIDRFLLDEGTKPSDRYTASSRLLAGYAGMNASPGKWTLSGGLRVEDNVQRLQSARDQDPVSVNNRVLSWLPSLNVAYNLTTRTLLRAAYSRSVNRPEFREYAPFRYYDFNNQVNVEGNDSLRVPRIDNIDLRWEYYPSPEELVSFGFFYKRFTDPIEIRITEPGNSSPNWKSSNARYANSFGVETEVRKSLNSLTATPWLQRVSVVLNGSWIYNRVNLGNVTAQAAERTMMNQSPYLINAGLFYNHPGQGWQASLLYNIFGKRLFYAGDLLPAGSGNYPDAYELPRHQVDAVLVKTWGDTELRLGVQDILNAPFRFFQDSNRDGKISPGNPDEPLIQYRRGQYVSAGVKYSF